MERRLGKPLLSVVPCFHSACAALRENIGSLPRGRLVSLQWDQFGMQAGQSWCCVQPVGCCSWSQLGNHIGWMGSLWDVSLPLGELGLSEMGFPRNKSKQELVLLAPHGVMCAVPIPTHGHPSQPCAARQPGCSQPWAAPSLSLQMINAAILNVIKESWPAGRGGTAAPSRGLP